MRWYVWVDGAFTFAVKISRTNVPSLGFYKKFWETKILNLNLTYKQKKVK